MALLTAPQSVHQLIRTLKQKVALLISQNLVTRLEISQLQQENTRLMAQLREQDIPTAKRVQP